MDDGMFQYGYLEPLDKPLNQMLWMKICRLHVVSFESHGCRKWERVIRCGYFLSSHFRDEEFDCTVFTVHRFHQLSIFLFLTHDYRQTSLRRFAQPTTQRRETYAFRLIGSNDFSDVSLQVTDINVARMRKETTSNNLIWNHCILVLGFGFNYFLKCSPLLGEDEPILISIFFKWVGKKPPTSRNVWNILPLHP